MALRQRILIVEDDEDLQRLFRTVLTFAGYDVQVVGDGLYALRRIDSDPPTLVVLDLSLPSVSGIVVRQEIAASALTRHIPIVVVTGSPERARDLDVACVLTKPVSAVRLVDAVKACI